MALKLTIKAITFLTIAEAIDVKDIRMHIQHSIAICTGLTLLVVSLLILSFLESVQLGAANGVGINPTCCGSLVSLSLLGPSRSVTGTLAQRPLSDSAMALIERRHHDNRTYPKF